MTTTVHCPKCDSQVLHLKHVAHANLLVVEWTIEDGEIDSAECDHEVDLELEASDVESQYVCGECDAEIRQDDLIVRGTGAVA